jgi:hypothetical protein
VKQQAILQNKDLNLPSQKEMLAMFRCEQIAQGALEEFQKKVESLRAQLDEGNIVERFGEEATEVVQTALRTHYS